MKKVLTWSRLLILKRISQEVNKTYNVINILLKNANFCFYAFPFNNKCTYPHYSKRLEYMTKYLEIIVLEIKTSTMNSKRNINILNIYILSAQASMTPKQYSKFHTLLCAITC